jgi:two-component system, chemotaxis family, chemotaxis protein CheY
MRVMVIEDDADLLEAVCEALEDEGFDAVACSGGAEALARLRVEPPPAVILLDLMMPVMSGWQFLDHRREDPTLADIPVVVMTASRNYDPAALDAHACLEKPVSFARLVDAVRRYGGPGGAT